MKVFHLNRFELILIYALVGVFIYSGSMVVKHHYQVVHNAYTFSKLKDRVSRSQNILENLRVERSRIIVPKYLEQAAGRGGYVLPKQEQIILLNQRARPTHQDQR